MRAYTEPGIKKRRGALRKLSGAALLSALLSACGGGGDDGASFSGVAAIGAPLVDTTVAVYNAAGKQCASGRTDSNGQYTLSGDCTGPVIVMADTPELEGKALYALVPNATKGERVVRNLTPITSAIAQLVIGAVPVVGAALNKTTVTAPNVEAATQKVQAVLAPVVEGMGLPSQDFTQGPIVVGQGQDLLLDLLTVTSELIPTTSQHLIRFQLATEHRPIVLVRNTRKAIELAEVDPGLGVDLELVDASRLRAVLPQINEIRGTFEGMSAIEMLGRLDDCYLHNGSRNLPALYDMPAPFTVHPATSVSNVRVVNYNTRTNFRNATEEAVNNGGADLAQVSWDYLDGHGLKQRAFTWAIKGSQVVNGCSSSGTGWRVLGNQRPVYVRTDTYSLHKIMYNSAFAGRADTYGSGTEHFISDNGAGSQYAFALVSGPGLPDNGAIFLRLDGAYLKYKGTLAALRSAAANGNMKPVYDQVEDTRSVVMNDVAVKEIADGFFAPQNRYLVRLFANVGDLYPTLTFEDILPKRPYLNTELTADRFPSVGVNLDALVTSLQTGSPVTVNWSIPTDSRGRPMLPHHISFNRKTCTDVKTWPNCAQRSAQSNQYSLGARYFFDQSITSVELTPPSLPAEGTKTFESHVRFHMLDSLARPMEVSVGMTYQR
jgi:hypothetical protein